MTAFTPFCEADVRLMWHVLARWETLLSSTQISPGPLLDHLRLHFPQRLQGPVFEQSLIHETIPFTMSDRGWLIGGELNHQTGVVPVVSVSLAGTSDRIADAAIRVALISARSDGTIQAEGWRFEQAEPNDPSSPPAHPYSHAQSIIGWTRDVDCLIHPPHPVEVQCNGIDEAPNEDLNDERMRAQQCTFVRHPAFPLGMETLTGLAGAVVATLYGGSGLKKIVEGDRRLQVTDDAISSDFARLGLS